MFCLRSYRLPRLLLYSTDFTSPEPSWLEHLMYLVLILVAPNPRR